MITTNPLHIEAVTLRFSKGRERVFERTRVIPVD